MFAGREDKRRRRGGRGEQSVLPEGTKRQRVARRQDASEANLQPMPEFMTGLGRVRLRTRDRTGGIIFFGLS